MSPPRLLGPAGRARPGVGVDVVHVPRLAARLADQPGLAAALFTPAERRAAERSAEPSVDLALGFAAKEALLKALGRGLVATGLDAALLEIEVQAEGPRPTLALTGKVAAAVERRGAARPLLSLARAGAHALATVLLVPADLPRGRAMA